MSIDWTTQLLEQLTWHWGHHVRPRLDGLTDEEYLWEPAPGCWSIRDRGGVRVPDFEYPEPDPAPLTTIAWRLAHVIIGVFGARNASHFGGPPMDYQSFTYAADAAGALAQLDDVYTTWTTGVAGLDEAGLARPVGPAEGPFAEFPYATLILHINREAIHHLAEVLLLRDLHRVLSRE
jgi:hypothetical protein